MKAMGTIPKFCFLLARGENGFIAWASKSDVLTYPLFSLSNDMTVMKHFVLENFIHAFFSNALLQCKYKESQLESI